MQIILASGSPRRRELMEMLRPGGVRIIPAVGEERADPALPPEELVKALSRQKAEEVAAAYAGPDDVVIGADTVVALDGAILGKPKDEADAARMLRALSGRTHRVWTGLALVRGGKVLGERAARTAVRFRAYGEDEIDRQIASGEPMDKAGAYGIQSFGARLAESVDGCFYNIVGLPIFAVIELLENRGSEP